MRIFSSISIQDRVDFSKNLSLMLRSGIPIDEALTSLADQSESLQFRTVVSQVESDIINGNSLSKSFEKHEQVFGKVFVSMIKAGEQSGTLQDNLQFLSNWLSRIADLRREVAAATLYPKLVFGAALLLGGGLSVFILPKLIPLFTSMKVELPLITKALLTISLFIQNYWPQVIIGTGLIFTVLVYSNKIKAIRRFYHLIYIHTPFFGQLMRDYQMALITQLFGTLLKSGLTLNESVEVVSNAATNIHYQEALIHIHQEILKGTTLSDSMIHSGKLFPNIAVNIIAVGEKSGLLSTTFEYLSEFYTKEVNIQAKKLPTVIEPILLIFIAVIVGFVALAIVMPIYEISGNIS